MPTKPKILLVNPPIYDFSAHDFWLKPYGMLRIAGMLRNSAEMTLFDYLDRLHSHMRGDRRLRRDRWGKGQFCWEHIPKPKLFPDMLFRRYRRYGLPREIFRQFLAQQAPFDFAFIQTSVTYWYLGTKEVIEDVRSVCPQAKIVLGGVYSTLCHDHAAGLGADLVVRGANLQPLWQLLQIEPQPDAPTLWEVYPQLEAGVLKLTDGCPYRCTYCSVPQVYGGFRPRPLEPAVQDLKRLTDRGVRNIAFYDDALLIQPEETLGPFLSAAVKLGRDVNFHTPNALHARCITPDLARLLVTAGFKTFFLGFESSSNDWQRRTGGKVRDDELAGAVENLKAAGADPRTITAYIIIGHPADQQQQAEAAMRFVNSLGIRVMLAEFSPIPGTPDGEACRQWVDLDEPLLHNKTAFAIARLGVDEVNRLKMLCKTLNKEIGKRI